MIITSTIGWLEHKSLLFKVTCKKTAVHHTDYTGRPMRSITISIWNKIHIWAGVYKQGSIIHHLHCEIYLTSQIVKTKILQFEKLYFMEKSKQRSPRLAYTFCAPQLKLRFPQIECYFVLGSFQFKTLKHSLVM